MLRSQHGGRAVRFFGIVKKANGVPKQRKISPPKNGGPMLRSQHGGRAVRFCRIVAKANGVPKN